jgi:mannose-6-phosphate isomerase
MQAPVAHSALSAARHAHARLLRWLQCDAYPLWAQQGVDHTHGGFHERLSSSGEPSQEARRARVQVRQIYAFALAPSLGWQGDAAGLVAAGLDYFLAHYRRADGLFRTLIAADGSVLDDRALLYDQAFVLLALADSQRVLGARPQLLAEARTLRSALLELLRHGPGFASGVPEALPLLSNPHMHLLEATLAWMSISDEPAWNTLAEAIVGLALDRFIDPASGALYEQFDAHWRPLDARIVEPGHQFEWAWLLLRWCRAAAGTVAAAAGRLFDIGETYGVRDGVTLNALAADFSVLDAQARLWPQTERICAAARLAQLTGQPRYWWAAAQAADTLLRYLHTELPGLWYDRLPPEGQWLQDPSPASSFYHIVCAIAELGAVLDADGAPRAP